MTRREKIILHARYGASIYICLFSIWLIGLFIRTTFTMKYEPLWWIGIIFSAVVMFAFGRRVERTDNFISTHHKEGRTIE